MADNEIIKALECCLIKDCDNCPYDQYACDPHLERDALNLINRLKDENKDLRQIVFTDRSKAIKNLKTEAVREFAERVKTEFYYEFDEIIPSIMSDKIDNLLEKIEKEI